MRRRTRLALAVTAAVVLALVGLGAVLYAEPIAAFRWWSRVRLGFAGFQKARLVGEEGDLVYFTGGPPPAEGASTLVLVHGLGDQAATWLGVAPRLAERFRVVLLDLPGHGESGPAEGALSFGGQTAALASVADAASPGQPVILIGNSLGGWVALGYAVQHPERVSRLVLINSAGLHHDLGDVTLTPDNRNEARRMVAAIFGPKTPDVPDFILDDIVDRSRRGPARRLWPNLTEEDLFDQRLSEVAVPVELVWGGGDGLLPMSYAEKLERGLPDARLHTLPGCAHSPQVTCPEGLTELLKTLLTESRITAPSVP